MKLLFLCLKKHLQVPSLKKTGQDSCAWKPAYNWNARGRVNVCLPLPDLSQFLSSHWASNEFIDITLAHGSTDLNINGKKEKQKVMYVCMYVVDFFYICITKQIMHNGTIG